MAKVKCAIKCTDFEIEKLEVKDKPEVVDNHEGYSTEVMPQITHFGDDIEYIVQVGIETSVFEAGKICCYKTLSTFQLQFSEPYKVLDHTDSEFVIDIFAQLFLYSNGQAHGAFKKEMRGTLFENTILSTKFLENLRELTKNAIDQNLD